MDNWREMQIRLDANADILELCARVNRSLIRALNQRNPNCDDGFIVEERFKYRTKYSNEEYEYYVETVKKLAPIQAGILLSCARVEITNTEIIVRILDSILED